MITFTKAVEVAPGRRVSSREHNLLARAINERFLSGLGDGCFRVVEYMLGLFRAITMGEDEFKTHAEDEFFTVFQSVRPNVANYPTTGVDPESGLPEPNGPNLSNPAMAWVYGRKAYAIDPESTRLSKVSVPYPSDSTESKWAHAKLQRGIKDPDSGVLNSPARELAWEYARFAYLRGGQFGTSYGGFLPGPDRLPVQCLPPCDLTLSSCNQFARDNVDVVFTATRPDVSDSGLSFEWHEEVDWPLDADQKCIRGHYAGTCSPCLDYDPVLGGANRCPESNYARHINFWYEVPAGYVVVLNDGTVDHLPHNDWVEGPYTRVTKLSRGLGEQLSRAINAFNCEFRGSESQRSGRLTPATIFPAQSFFTSQYPLAPARGVQIGDELIAQYPAWSLSPGHWPAGSMLTGGPGAEYSWHDGFVATHAFAIVRGAGGIRSVALTILHSGGSVRISATDSGVIKSIPAECLKSVRIQLDAEETIAPGEELVVELTEVEEYKPTLYDLYAVLRKGGARLVGAGGGDFANAFVDGQGTDEDSASQIGRDLANYGCIVNQHEVQNISDPTSANENAVFEAARRLSRVVRILNRFSLVDYAVAGGKSILWFTPHPRTADHPMDDPRSDGDPEIDLFDDLVVAPAAAGFPSQRWVLDCWLKAGSESESSMFKLDWYSDQIPDVNRCMFLDMTIEHDRSFIDHVNRGQPVLGNGSLFAQAPSGWNYAQLLSKPGGTTYWINHAPYSDPSDRTNFAKSCRLYEPPVELESVERVMEGTRELVKVTLKGRLHSTAGEAGGAPAEIARSDWVNSPDEAGLWDWGTINAEPYRSTENALRMYLFWRWGKHALPSPIVGDMAATGLDFSGRRGSIFPSFYLVKLIPEVPIDQNDLPDASDATFDHAAEMQAEWYLRCLSEGCVAGQGALDCSDPGTARMYDWDWPNLCRHLFGLRSVSAFATTPTFTPAGAPLLRDSDVRPDGPEGFGPIPGSRGSSEVFNRLVRIVNDLNRFRVMLPWNAEFRTTAMASELVDAEAGGVNHGCGIASDCSATESGARLATNQAPPSVGVGTWGDWGPGTIASAYTRHNIVACYSGPNWAIASTRTVAQFRFNLVDWEIYQFAIPPLWRDMVSDASEHCGAVFAWTRELSRVTAGSGETTCPGDSEATFSCDFGLDTTSEKSCRFLKNGEFTLDCGPRPLGGWAYYWDNGPGAQCFAGSEIAQSIELITDTCPVLEIPLSAREEWEKTPWLPE